MNEPIHKNCIAERDWLRREYERLTAENAKFEAARKVADAAVILQSKELPEEIDEASEIFSQSVDEYRRVMNYPAPSCAFFSRPAVEKAFATVSVIESSLTEEAAQGILANARRMADGEC